MCLPLTGECRHGRVLQLRVEEILDTITVDYRFSSEEYVDYYSVQRYYLAGGETFRHALYDKVARRICAFYFLKEDNTVRKENILRLLHYLGSHTVQGSVRGD